VVAQAPVAAPLADGQRQPDRPARGQGTGRSGTGGANAGSASFPFVMVGSHASTLFGEEDAKELGKLAGSPLVILGSRDEVCLKGLGLPCDIPKLRDPVRKELLDHITVRELGAMVPDAAGARSYILVQDSPDLVENGIREVSGLNFAGHRISRDRDLLHDIQLFRAAQEATLVRLLQRGSPADYHRAAAGALTFLDEHQDLFRKLEGRSNKDRDEYVRRCLLGYHALGVLFRDDALDPGNLSRPDMKESVLIATLRPSGNHPEANREEQLQGAVHDVMQKIGMRMYRDWPMLGVASFTAATSRAWPNSHVFEVDPAADETGVVARYMETAKRKGLDPDEAFANFALELEWLSVPRFSEEQKRRGQDLMREYGITDDALQSFVKSGEPFAIRAVFAHERSSAANIAITGADRRLIDPKDPFVQNVLKAVAQLKAEGAFRGSQEQRAFAENILAGARFFGVVQPAAPIG
jgi:hypothetical protein